MPVRNRVRPTLRATLRDYAALRPFERLTPDSVRFCPPGSGQPILVLPGILRGDSHTRRFRDALTMLDYQPFGWELGINLGPTQTLIEGATVRLAKLAQAHGPVRVIGFSMGGLFARFLAHARPHLVSQVITVCSPFRDAVNSAWLPVRPLLGLWPHTDVGAMNYMVGQTPPVPWAALYSKLDGVVAWRNCQDQTAPGQCFEVKCRHKFAALEEGVLRQVAECLKEGVLF